MKKIKKLFISSVVVIIILSIIVPVAAQAAMVGGTRISSSGAVVIDFETGIVLFGHNETVQRVPASMVKMVAVHVIYDAIRDGKTTMDSRIRISQSTAEFSRDRTWSNVTLVADTTYSVRELLEVVIIRSANAATVALGEGIFGSEAAFVHQMNAKAGELNIRAHFADSWGGSPDNRISPLALAWMMRALLQDHPEVIEISSMRSVRFRGSDPLPNTNHLLTRYSGADGLKTGFTNPAGFCLVGTAVRDGRRLISVVMGNSVETRFPDTETLLNFGFANAERILDDHFGRNRAAPSSANLILNGEEMPISAYLIDGSHYFKLRDIAFLLMDTQASFGVRWSSEDRAIHLTSGEAYTPVGSEMTLAVEGNRPFVPTPSIVYLNGVPHDFEAFLIDGSNFFRLRDLGEVLGFTVEWENETRTVILNTIRETENDAYEDAA